MRWTAGVRTVWCVLASLAGISLVSAQMSGEMLCNFMVDWLQTARLTRKLDVEPKTSMRVPAGKPVFIHTGSRITADSSFSTVMRSIFGSGRIKRVF